MITIIKKETKLSCRSFLTIDKGPEEKSDLAVGNNESCDSNLG